jgi:hypothetical protein
MDVQYAKQPTGHVEVKPSASTGSKLSDYLEKCLVFLHPCVKKKPTIKKYLGGS